jgi:hypothetical protein
VYATVVLFVIESTRLSFFASLALADPPPASPPVTQSIEPPKKTLPTQPFPFDPPRKIPERPTAPPRLGTTLKEPRYACKRQILAGGKLVPCDSFTQRDGERLRPYFLEVPEAMEHLEVYQMNRRNMEWLPYIGTAGLLVAGIGFLTERLGAISTSELDANGNPKPLLAPETGRIIRNVSLGIGGIVLVSTFTYGFITLTLNERNFDNAVRKYNEARPQAPIEIKVEGTMFFDVR